MQRRRAVGDALVQQTALALEGRTFNLLLVKAGWAATFPARMVLAPTNTTQRMAAASIRIHNLAGRSLERPVNLKPRETRLVNIP
jgi:endonuclease YncB( thermonuclease family)